MSRTSRLFSSSSETRVSYPALIALLAIIAFLLGLSSDFFGEIGVYLLTAGALLEVTAWFGREDPEWAKSVSRNGYIVAFFGIMSVIGTGVRLLFTLGLQT